MKLKYDFQVFEYLDMDLKKHMDDTESIYNNTNVGLDPSQNVLKGLKVIKSINQMVPLCIFYYMHGKIYFDSTRYSNILDRRTSRKFSKVVSSPTS